MAKPEIDAASAGLLRRGGPPLAGLLRPLLDWYEQRHIELMADAGFDDVRRAHNAVFVHVPAEGIRLTGLAARAEMSKQAMGELVDDLVDKGYFERVPDPTDGRAKLIVWADRGEEAHRVTLEVFGRLESELADILGRDRLDDVKGALFELVRAVVAPPPE